MEKQKTVQIIFDVNLLYDLELNWEEYNQVWQPWRQCTEGVRR